MWQRFTQNARQVVFYAQEEAQKFGEGYVSTEHLMLGLIRDRETTATRVLEKLGVRLDRVRPELEELVPRGDARPSQDMTLTPRAKQVIDLAYEEARNLNNNYIGTEHLLLGMVRQGDGLAGRVLAKLGVELAKARHEVTVLQGVSPDAPSVRSAPESATVQDYAFRMALLLAGRQRRNLAEILILTLVADPDNSFAKHVATFGGRHDQLVLGIESLLIQSIQNDTPGTGPQIPALFKLAAEEAAILGNPEVTPTHIILALLVEGSSPLVNVFKSQGIAPDDLRAILRNSETTDPPQ